MSLFEFLDSEGSQIRLKDRVLFRGFVHTVIASRPKKGELLIRLHGHTEWQHSTSLTLVPIPGRNC